MNETPTPKWIAYRHVNGHIKVRHFDQEFAKDLIDQMESSPFVDAFLYPYQAPDRKQAEQKALELLKKNDASQSV